MLVASKFNMLRLLKYIPSDFAKELYVQSSLPLNSIISSEQFVQMLKMYNNDNYKHTFIIQIRHGVIDLQPSDFRELIGLFKDDHSKNFKFVYCMRKKVKIIDVSEIIKCLMLYTSDAGRYFFASFCFNRFANIPGNMLVDFLNQHSEDEYKTRFVSIVLNKIISINLDDLIKCLKTYQSDDIKYQFVLTAKKRLIIDQLDFKGLRECFDPENDYYLNATLNTLIKIYLSDGKIINISDLFASINDVGEICKFEMAMDFVKNIVITDNSAITQHIKNKHLIDSLVKHYNKNNKLNI